MKMKGGDLCKVLWNSVCHKTDSQLMSDTGSKGSTYQTLSYILFTELRKQTRTLLFLILKSARCGEYIKDIKLKDTKIQI